MLLQQAPLHLVKDEAHGKARQEAQPRRHICRLLAGINAVIEHGNEVGQGSLVHGGDEG